LVRGASVLFLALAGLGLPLRGQAPDELVGGVKLGQDMTAIKKAFGSQLRRLLRNRTDSALAGCGVESFAIDHGGQRLEITSVGQQVVKLDLSRETPVLDPATMATQFIKAYGAPQKVACKQLSGQGRQVSQISQCGKGQTYVQLNYQWGESGAVDEVDLRVRLRATTPGFSRAYSRVTLSRGWDYRVPRIEACAKTMKRQSDSTISEAPHLVSGRYPYEFWWDPVLDSGWVYFYVYETIYYWE
jgi:hypothetical protein